MKNHIKQKLKSSKPLAQLNKQNSVKDEFEF